MVIDLAAFAGKSPTYVLENTSDDEYQPAGVELLALLMLQLKWVTSWGRGCFGNKNFYPNLTGLQLHWDAATIYYASDAVWSCVPCLSRQGDIRHIHQFKLTAGWRPNSDDSFASPCFREC